MNNFALFICGTVIALISGMGVLVYFASLGYKKNLESILEKTVMEKAVVKSVDLNEQDSMVEIPSAS
jgi:hypothetical protein